MIVTRLFFQTTSTQFLINLFSLQPMSILMTPLSMNQRRHQKKHRQEVRDGTTEQDLQMIRSK